MRGNDQELVRSDGQRKAARGAEGQTAYERLPRRRRRFVDAYLGRARGNAAEAARLAGYSRASAVQQGYLIKKNAMVQAAITERLNELAISAEAVLAELAAIARGSMADFINLDAAAEPEDGKKGRASPGPWLDLKKAGDADALGLVQEVARTQHGLRIKLYSRLEALHLLAKHHGLFTEKLELPEPEPDPLPWVTNVELMEELRTRFGWGARRIDATAPASLER